MTRQWIMARLGAGPTGSPPNRRARVGHSLGRARARSGVEALRTGHARLIFVAVLFAAGFALLGARLVDLAMERGPARNASAEASAAAIPRAEIVDRNGVVLASNLSVASLYANPRAVLDAAAAADALAAALPELSRGQLLERLSADRSFVWLRRHLSPRQQAAVHALGIPGIGFREEQRRVYPLGSLAPHVVGYADIDNHGLAGIEKSLDDALAVPGAAPVRLSLDVRAQHILRDELAAALETFGAAGAAGLVMDVRTGEILALVSLPDFDPNLVANSQAEARFNRATLGVYEPGSTLKILTMAMALDYGTATLEDRFDATQPLRIARFTIGDSHARDRWLTVPEIFVYSSNVGAARMALEIGPERQRAFFERMGLLARPAIELAEVGAPMIPAAWGEVSAVTISYGHGIALSPLQLTGVVAALVNGGHAVSPTLLRAESAPLGANVVSSETSDALRALLRLNVLEGTGALADAAGYVVGGKTGTAEKARDGGYASDAVVSSFLGAFPMDAPRYAVFVMLDEPRGTADTQGFAAAGWTVAPVVAQVVARLAPLLGIAPRDAGDKGTAAGALFISLDGRRIPGAAF